MMRTPLTIGGTALLDDARQPENEQPVAEPVPADGARPVVDEANLPLRHRVINATRKVFDPEIPVNIYELGLIYDVEVDDVSGDVKIKMTLTSPACPAAQELPLSVRSAVGRVVGVNDVDVEIVFEPPWSPDKMSEAAKLQLGLL